MPFRNLDFRLTQILLKLTHTYSSLQKFVRTYQNLFLFAQTCWALLKFYWNLHLLEHSEICYNLLELIETYSNWHQRTQTQA